MGKVSWPGSALLAPLPPVLVTSGNKKKTNVLTIAWTGIVNTRPPITYISIRPSRLSHELVTKYKEFTINFTTKDLVKAVDFCGVRSGREINKIEMMGLELEPGIEVNCPMLKKSPVSLECKLRETISLGSHDLFLADIVAVHVQENLLDDQGKLHLEKSGLIAYAHGEYFELGKKCGSFGYSVRKKKQRKKNSALRSK